MPEGKDSWDGHKEVKDLISRVPDLHRINISFEKTEKEYADKSYDDEYLKSSDEKEIFDNVLWSFVFYKHELGKQLSERPFTGLSIKEEIFENAKKYLDSKFIHNSFLTSSILTQAIDTELVPLECEVNGTTHPIIGEISAQKVLGPAYPVKWSNFLPYPWNKLVSYGLSLIFFIIGILIISFFLSADLNWIAWIITILLAWHYIHKIFLLINSTRIKRRLAELCANLRIIRDEVASHSYDGKVIAERLKKLENDGLYVHSLVYPLLELSAKKA